MALTLRAAITANDTVFDVTGTDALSPGDLKTIGSEHIQIRTANRATTGYGETAYYRVNAYRGVIGTTAAAHAAASALTTTSLGGGDEGTPLPYMDPTTSTPESIVDAMIDGGKMDGPP